MILAYRVLERRIKALRRAILHAFFVLNLNMHKYDDFMNVYCDKKGTREDEFLALRPDIQQFVAGLKERGGETG